MFLETRQLEGKAPGTEAPGEVFEEVDASVVALCCPYCWETGLSLEAIPHKPGCPLAKPGVS